MQPTQILAGVEFGIDVLEILNYGAVGILALGFLTLLYLFWRKDRDSSETIRLLREVQDAFLSQKSHSDDVFRSEEDKLDKMIEVVQQNTEAMTSIRMAVEQNTQAIQRLDTDVSRRLDDQSRDLRAILGKS